MNEHVPENTSADDQKIAQRLAEASEEIHVNARFAAELEEKLRTMRRPKHGPLASLLRPIPQVLLWATLTILLVIVLSWSIKSLIPRPEPATESTILPTNTVIPTFAVTIDQTATPDVSQPGVFSWRGTKLYLATSLPDAPSEANIFLVQPEQPATRELVRALADRFGIQGEIFEGELEPNAPSAFYVVDGNQRLTVRSDRYFQYVRDTTVSDSEDRFSLSNPNAAALIDEFMSSHDFNFPYTIERSELFQGFYVQAVTPDGFPIHHEFFTQNGLLFRLNDRQVISVSGSLLTYDLINTYEIKSAEEALQQVVTSTDLNGMIEGVHSSGPPLQRWRRDYPLDERVTIYGFMNVIPAGDGTPRLVRIDQYLARGNLAGTENIDKPTLVKATGHFLLENGDKVFDVESWETVAWETPGFASKDAFFGTLQQQGGKVVLVSENGTFTLPNVPADVPVPLENAYVYGVALGDTFEWEGIEHRETSADARGGGASSGNGFYKLNLSGTPVPFPTAVQYVVKADDTCDSIGAQFGVSVRSIIVQNQISENCLISAGQTLILPAVYIVQENDTLSSIALNAGTTVEKLMQLNALPSDVIITGQKLLLPASSSASPLVGQRLDGRRAMLEVAIYKRPDGTQRVQYRLTPMAKGEKGFVLEGSNLQDLQAHHNLPVDIWGTVERMDQNGIPVVSVERYEIPFPDLKIQRLQGKQRLTPLAGRQAVLFTAANGTTYVQMLNHEISEIGLLGVEGDPVILEALAIPGESFGGYPILHVFRGEIAVNPRDIPSPDSAIVASQPYVFEETDGTPGSVPLDLITATIEKIELVYYTPDSRYARFGENSDVEYIQPAWRFYGHYSNGTEFEILIQALKQEVLRPELAPFTRPG